MTKHAIKKINKNKFFNIDNFDNYNYDEAIYDVKSNISYDTNFVYICFIVDIDIYNAFTDQIQIMIQGILNDFIQFSKLNNTKLNYEISLVVYNDYYCSDIYRYNSDIFYNIFIDLSSIYYQKKDVENIKKGYSYALNNLLQLKEDDEKIVFLIPNGSYYSDNP